MKKILLVNSPELRGGILAPNLGLAYIQSYLTSKGFDVDLLDLRVDHESLEDKINSFSPDIIGFSAFSHERPVVLNLANEIRQSDNKIPIFFGGISPTINPENYLFDEGVYVIRGEGEETTYKTILALLNDSADLSTLTGTSFKKKDKIVHTPRTELIKDLDSIPMPSIDQYFDKKKFNQFQIMISRGCYYGCLFCSSKYMWNRVLRTHSPKRVADEIGRLVDNGINEFVYADDAITLDLEWSKNIAEEIISRGYKINTPLNSRVDFIDNFTSDDEVINYLKLLKKAGCNLIVYGLETGSQNILNRIKKNTNVEQAKKSIELTKKSGIAVKVNLIVGLPGSYNEQMETLKFFNQLSQDYLPDYVTIRYFVPNEGIDITDKKLFGLKIRLGQLHFDSKEPLAEFTNVYFKLTLKDQVQAMKNIVDGLLSRGYSNLLGQERIIHSPLTQLQVPPGKIAYFEVSKGR